MNIMRIERMDEYGIFRKCLWGCNDIKDWNCWRFNKRTSKKYDCVASNAHDLELGCSFYFRIKYEDNIKYRMISNFEDTKDLLLRLKDTHKVKKAVEYYNTDNYKFINKYEFTIRLTRK